MVPRQITAAMRQPQEALQQVRDHVAQQLKHTGMNKAILVFGAVFALLLAVMDFHNRQGVLPEFVAMPFRVGVIVFGSYFIASILIRLTADLVSRLIKDAEIEHKLLVRKAYSGLIYALATLLILWKLGLSIQNLTILLGFVATGFAFAVRDVVLAYLAWYVLLIKRPFRIGDHIKIGDDEGKVMHIGTFHVLIDNSPNTKDDFIRIPGRLFLEKPLRNFGPRSPIFTARLYVEQFPKDYEAALRRIISKVKRKTGVEVELSLDSDLEKRYVYLTFRCGYDDRAKVKEQVLFCLSQEKGFWK